jgi:hypothetical protein
MEKVTVAELKQEIMKAKNKSITDPLAKQMLEKIETAVSVCPPQFLRISKMYHTIKQRYQ